LLHVAELAGTGRPGRHNDLTDVAGIRVGHHQRRGRGWLTGTTVVLTPPGTVGGVDVRGGGPSTRETDALSPTTLVDAVHAVVLSGGSSYGLAAATGVTDWLGDRHVGFPVGPEPHQVVPIVPAACLFDLGAGGSFAHRPDAMFGRAAAEAATARAFRQGTVGAGTGAHAGALKGGVGSASVVLPSGITVAALVALNPGGSVVDPATGDLYGRRHLLAGELPGLRRPNAADARAARAGPAGPAAAGNTLLAVVATDAALAKHECTRLAVAGHDGMARAVRPIHAMTDGDLVFALATGRHPLPDDASPGMLRPSSFRPGQLTVLMTAAADAVTRAIVHAVVAATSTATMTSYLERYPSAGR
jgi:putative pantetheine hydrolase